VAGPSSFERGRRFTSREVAPNRPRNREGRYKKPLNVSTLARVFNIAKARWRQEEESSLEADSSELREEELLAAPQFVATRIKTRPGVYFVLDDFGTITRANSLQSRPPMDFRTAEPVSRVRRRITKPQRHTSQPGIIIDFAKLKKENDRRPRARRSAQLSTAIKG